MSESYLLVKNSSHPNVFEKQIFRFLEDFLSTCVHVDAE
jgi:hypothetical protein